MSVILSLGINLEVSLYGILNLKKMTFGFNGSTQ